MNLEELAAVEADSIRRFVEQAIGEGWLHGAVLDFGCGKQPYKRLIPGVYHGYDRKTHPASTTTEDIGDFGEVTRSLRWDAILCTQAIQYFPSPQRSIRTFYSMLKPGGWLLMTGPTNWPEVESDDLWRFTVQGVGRLFHNAMFEEIEVSSRATVELNDIVFSLGWGAVGRRPG